MPQLPTSNSPISATAVRPISGYVQAAIRWIKQEQTQFGLQVFVRASAALLAGYVAAATLACLLTQVLPMPRFESTLTANMLAFLFYAIAIIYAFCVRKTWHAWRDLTLFSLLCFALLKVCGQ
ncbi:DUF3649 domain-containing protein [Shewanella oneidensis MR-1]|uniref:Siderophore transporter component 1 n=1 Tax=Shewanella oneidensis (strain ATCC 700550 / JCM 31522 / CIP 106686 / LMG 19005 / NCIMB 14063 / MR-1) TaxID=211586 RepID=Q8EBU3_SHEON|nr:DUF3649 domain-containing protein [Shewanella oneidensis]AAN56403.2 putative siderophore transporter component 1 [Shewanella oneidensis MR-1]MDX5999185.1 DUF3649 domain-containing protein [Shewanella oneidensis]MEE2028346.1 hypothetical protein [Shewanella oneidensis]QKG97799.1 DUF3649 domain-containing protein [Shewanella oneidensis MR-1]